MVVTLVLAVAGAAAASTNTITDVPVYVNYASFASAFNGEDPTRVIDLAIGSWAEQGSGTHRFYVAGSTTSTSCDPFGRNIIFGSPDNVNNCGSIKAACNYTCGPYFAIDVDIGHYRWTLGSGSILQSDFDFTSLITHEVGHAVVGPNHVNTSGADCVMYVTPLDNEGQRYFCHDELVVMDNVGGAGHSSDHIWIAPSIASSPLSFTAPFPFSGFYDWGFGSIERGWVGSPSVVRSSAFVVNSALIPMTYDFNPNFGFTTGPVEPTRRRITTVFNPNDAQWIQFVLSDADAPLVDVYKSSDRVSWSHLGQLGDSSGRLINTRSSVAAAVDPLSHKIVAIVNQWTDAEYNYCASDYYGCVGTLHAFVLDPANGYSTHAVHAALTGHSGMFGGAVACGNVQQAFTSFQCLAVFIGTGTQRQIEYFEFGVGSGGVFFSQYNQSTLSGVTNMQPSLDWNASNGFALAVGGTDKHVYVATRSSLNSNWANWVDVGLTTKRGPSIRSLPGSSPLCDIMVSP